MVKGFQVLFQKVSLRQQMQPKTTPGKAGSPGKLSQQNSANTVLLDHHHHHHLIIIIIIIIITWPSSAAAVRPHQQETSSILWQHSHGFVTPGAQVPSWGLLSRPCSLHVSLLEPCDIEPFKSSSSSSSSSTNFIATQVLRQNFRAANIAIT